MVRGKKGFERVLYAFTNVFNDSKAWLFCNLNDPQNFSGPIAAFAPTVRRIAPTINTIEGVSAVDVDIQYDMDAEDVCELQEWMSLAMLESPRIRANDTIDSYLCRYSPPKNTSMINSRPIRLYKVQWRGLVHSGFVQSLFMELVEHATIDSWVAVSAHAFDNTSYTIIHKKDADNKILLCQCKG